MSTIEIDTSDITEFQGVMPYNSLMNVDKEQPKKYNSTDSYVNEKLIGNEKETTSKINEPELNNINIKEENQKDFIYTELFLAIFNRYYDNANKLIDMGVKINYPDNNFEETPLGLLLRYLEESPEEEKEKINSLIQKIIDKNIKIDYDKDPYNNYKVFKYLSYLISNEKYYDNFITFIKKYYVKDNILKFKEVKNFINITNYNILNVIQSNNIIIEYDQKKVNKNDIINEEEIIEDNNIDFFIFSKKYYDMLNIIKNFKQKNKQQAIEEDKKEEIDENNPNFIYDQYLLLSIIMSKNTPKVKFDAYNTLINTGYKLEINYDVLIKNSIKYGCIEIFKSLIDKGAVLNIETFNLLLGKLSNGIYVLDVIIIDKDIIDLIYNLIETNIKLNEESIRLIISINNLKLFYIAIHKFTDFNDKNFESFIREAIIKNNKQIIKELINLGAKLEKESCMTYSESYIYHAILNNNYKLALFLIDNGAKVNFNDVTVFTNSLLYFIMKPTNIVTYPIMRKNVFNNKPNPNIIPPYDISNSNDQITSYCNDLKGNFCPIKVISPWMNSSTSLMNNIHSKINPSNENEEEKIYRKQINNKHLIKLIKIIVEKSDYLSYSFDNINSFQESPFSIAFRYYSDNVAKHVLYNVVKRYIKIYYNNKYSKYIIDYEIINFINKVYDDIFIKHFIDNKIIENNIEFENIIDDFAIDQGLSEDIKRLLYREFNNILSNVYFK